MQRYLDLGEHVLALLEPVQVGEHGDGLLGGDRGGGRLVHEHGLVDGHALADVGVPKKGGYIWVYTCMYVCIHIYIYIHVYI